MNLDKYDKVYAIRQISTGKIFKHPKSRPYWGTKGYAQAAGLSHLKERKYFSDADNAKVAKELMDYEVVEFVVVPVRAINGLDIYPEMKKYVEPSED